MTARQDVLEAARSLATRGLSVFTPAELIAEARRLGSGYPDSTLRTHVTSHMCQDPATVVGAHADLVRIESGRYSLNHLHAEGATSQPSEDEDDEARPSDRMPVEGAIDPHDEWHWEGNVQIAVVRHLMRQGWEIMATADTATRQQGHDIVAERAGERLIVEVKGYPSSRHVGGPRHGQAKRTHPATQARHWFAGAVLTALLALDTSPSSRVVIALPDFDTYRSLAERTKSSLASAAIGIWFVEVGGEVKAI